MSVVAPRNEKFTFRQRGYLCKTCGYTTFIFGDGQEATGCPNCHATTLSKEWDNLVTTLTVVTSFTGASPNPVTPVQENAETPSASVPATPVPAIDPNSDAARQIPLPLGSPASVKGGTQSAVKSAQFRGDEF